MTTEDRIELLIQGAIAIVIVAGIVILAVLQMLLGKPIQVPDLLAFALMIVLGFFFGAARGRGVLSGLNTATNGMLSAAKTIVTTPATPPQENAQQ